jgi:hypothetical protein
VVLLYFTWVLLRSRNEREKTELMMHFTPLVLQLKKELLQEVVLLIKSKNVLSSIKADNADEATGIQIVSRAVEFH